MGKRFIRRCYQLFAIFIVFLCFTQFVYASDYQDEELRNLMQTYFNALKNGDVEVLKGLLTDPVLADRRMLLEQNTAYPEHLRNYYKNAGMVVREVHLTDDENIRVVTAGISFEGEQNPVMIQFLLKNTDEGWKISQEESMP